MNYKELRIKHSTSVTVSTRMQHKLQARLHLKSELGTKVNFDQTLHLPSWHRLTVRAADYLLVCFSHHIALMLISGAKIRNRPELEAAARSGAGA